MDSLSLDITFISLILDLPPNEIYQRFDYIETMISAFTYELNGSIFFFYPQDIKNIKNMICYINKRLNKDCLLEITILYYYIIHILEEDINTCIIENYFLINNFTDIVIEHIGLFSKSYFYASKCLV